MKLNPIKAALSPYTFYLKLGLAALLIGFLFVSGCNYGESRQEVKTVKAERIADGYRTQAEVLAAGIEEGNRQVAANQQAVREQAAIAAQAVKDAEAEKKKNTQQQKEFNKKLEAAKLDPDCKAVMEMKLCKVLQNY